MAEGKITPAEVYNLIPMSFPVTHNLPEFPFISKYPIDDWEAAGSPCFSKRSWYKLVMRICKNDMEHLGELFDTSETKEKLEADKEEMAANLKKPRLDAGSTAASSSGERV